MFSFNQRPRNVVGSVRLKSQNLSPFVTASLPAGGGNPQYGVTRFNPVTDRLDEASVVDDWIPKDASGLNRMFRLMALRDPIIGPGIELYSSLPWSEFETTGISDKTILRTYQDCFEALDLVSFLKDALTEYLVVGKSCFSLIFDTNRGYWTDAIAHDPDFLEITPIPMRGFDPKIDVIPSPAMKAFVTSGDPRDKDALKRIPHSYIEQVKRGRVPLDPANTLYFHRRANAYDSIGTSLLSRAIVFWALEKALINATMVSARRRSRAILHAQLGIDNVWEPTSAEMDMIGQLFTQADEDPTGAVVVTRNGVSVSEVRDGASFWKLSDEWTFLSEGKMRALGLSEALLSADANYNSADSAMTVFLEQLYNLRETTVKRIVINKICASIARANGFVKRSTAELSHNIRVSIDKDEVSNQAFSASDAQKIPQSMLILPQLVWAKSLRQERDEGLMGVLGTLEEKGLPVSMRQYAAAAGMDYEKMKTDLKSDLEDRKLIDEIRKKAGMIPEEGADEAYASVDNVRQIIKNAPAPTTQNIETYSKRFPQVADHIPLASPNLLTGV